MTFSFASFCFDSTSMIEVPTTTENGISAKLFSENYSDKPIQAQLVESFVDKSARGKKRKALEWNGEASSIIFICFVCDKVNLFAVETFVFFTSISVDDIDNAENRSVDHDKQRKDHQQDILPQLPVERTIAAVSLTVNGLDQRRVENGQS